MSRKITIDLDKIGKAITLDHVAISLGAVVCAGIGFAMGASQAPQVVERVVTKWKIATVTRTNPYFCEPLHKYLRQDPETVQLDIPLKAPTFSPNPKVSQYQAQAWAKIKAAEVKAQADIVRDMKKDQRKMLQDVGGR